MLLKEKNLEKHEVAGNGHFGPWPSVHVRVDAGDVHLRLQPCCALYVLSGEGEGREV